MGYYYSSVLDWSFLPGPIRSKASMDRLLVGQGAEYERYADAQLRELLERYKPDIAWNDIGYPAGGHPLEVIADYYNSNPDGVANDRWSPFKFGDFTTPEYKVATEIQTRKWEECRGVGHSFGLNRLEGEKETIPADELVHRFVDIVSKNGNLLLDVGPEPDGTIPAIQVDRLRKLGAWLKQNGDAIYATRPWTRAEGKTADGIDVRFTRRGDALYALLLARPTGSSVTLKDVPAPARGRATWLGASGTLATTAEGQDLKIPLPASLPGDFAWAVRLE
jgi:alpha-L-fucosidase